jgi:perosamine synthetase
VPERDFSLGDPTRRAATLTSFLLPRLVAGSVAGARARHYRRLLHDLAPWVPEPFRRDPEELSPFAFPVFVEDKERAAALLLREGIRAVNAWSVPHPSLPVHAFPGAAYRRSGTLLLPVHQELRAEDLDHIVSAARAALGPPVYAPASRRASAR